MSNREENLSALDLQVKQAAAAAAGLEMWAHILNKRAAYHRKLTMFFTSR